MKISILCSDERHPVYKSLVAWCARQSGFISASIVHRKAELSGGDILFLISCSEIVRADDRANFQNSFVIHASDLPKRRGWSPHIWALLDGESQITVSLLAADDPVDSGDIYQQELFDVAAGELLSEINEKLFAAELNLMDWAVANFGQYTPIKQAGDPSYCARRTPADSFIDVDKSIREQFDVLRLADQVRFPAYFDIHGRRYKISLETMERLNDPN
jgi:methionyl-tRNA formyltransferase